jgi:hypothetical protein
VRRSREDVESGHGGMKGYQQSQEELARVCKGDSCWVLVLNEVLPD